jgi:hypothetical protein
VPSAVRDPRNTSPRLLVDPLPLPTRPSPSPKHVLQAPSDPSGAGSSSAFRKLLIKKPADKTLGPGSLPGRIPARS